MTRHHPLADHAPMRTSPDPLGVGSTDSSSGVEAISLDDLLDVYVDWRERARAVGDAYARWSLAPASERAVRFAAYTATLDQEEKTAAAYARLVADLERRVQRSNSHDIRIDAPRTHS